MKSFSGAPRSWRARSFDCAAYLLLNGADVHAVDASGVRVGNGLPQALRRVEARQNLARLHRVPEDLRNGGHRRAHRGFDAGELVGSPSLVPLSRVERRSSLMCDCALHAHRHGVGVRLAQWLDRRDAM